MLGSPSGPEMEFGCQVLVCRVKGEGFKVSGVLC